MYSYLLLGKSGGSEQTDIMTLLLKRLNQFQRKEMLVPGRAYFGSEYVLAYQTLQDALQGLITLEEWLVKEGHRSQIDWIIRQTETEIRGRDFASRELTGTGLNETRTMLAHKGKTTARITILTGDRKSDYLYLQAFSLWQFFFTEWKIPRDNPFLNLFLEGYDYKEAADRMSVARPQAWKKYKSLNMAEYFAIREILLSGNLG